MKFKNILDQLLYEGVYDESIFKAIFLAGGPGSGKSFIQQKITVGHGFKLINSDNMFEYLLKKSNLSSDLPSLSSSDLNKALDLRSKAKRLTKIKTNIHTEARQGLIIDGTGRDFEKMESQVEDLRELGYDCYMIFVNTSLDIAQKRNITRTRKLLPKMVEKMWYDVQNNLGKFQRLFDNENMLIVDNNDAQKEDLDVAWKYI
jgi:dephospho-CoA kinase